ncbi:MAG: methyltransferase domain-containing protein [Pseudoxanthomonas sp.]
MPSSSPARTTRTKSDWSPTSWGTSLAPPLELWPSIAEYFVYDDLIYYALSSDELRNRVYRRAIARAVPGQIVLEIGTGAEAVLARMCVEEGARHVYAIEILEESYRKAKQRIAEAGMSDRITLIKGDATAITLPEPAAVCVSEIVGAIGGSEAAAYIINAAWRLLTPGAKMIPGRSVTRIAALTLPDDFLRAPAFTPLAAHYVEDL